MEITAIGLDTAKSVFQVHGMDRAGRPVVRKQLKRAQVLPFFANLPPCLVGMEACSASHYWARKLQALGHTVKLIAPQFVKPYVKGNKNDAADAEAICEAVTRANMRFVAIKSIEQQAVLSLHRVRQGFVKARTAQGNQIRGLLAEFGLVVPKGLSHLAERVPELLEDGSNEMPGGVRLLIQRLLERLRQLDREVGEVEAQIKTWHRASAASRKLEKVPGIGPITASATVVTVGDASVFKNGRQMSAWMGIVPKQHSSGGKELLLGISKRGDTYLRTLFIHGARAFVRVVKARMERSEPARDRTEHWVRQLLGRRTFNVVAVALANKNVRVAWALLTGDREFQSPEAVSECAA